MRPNHTVVNVYHCNVRSKACVNQKKYTYSENNHENST